MCFLVVYIGVELIILIRLIFLHSALRFFCLCRKGFATSQQGSLNFRCFLQEQDVRVGPKLLPLLSVSDHNWANEGMQEPSEYTVTVHQPASSCLGDLRTRVAWV